MFKRLLIAVFALGLIMALGSAAVADTGKGPIEEIQRMDPTNPRLNDLTSARPEQPAEKKPISTVGKVESGATLPPGTPLQYFCDLQDYTSGGLGYFWTIPDAYGDDLFNMRFTSDAGFDCSLKVANYLLYWESSVSGPKTFNSDMRCYLWDDDGFGFPGAKLDSVDIPFATIDAEHTAQGNIFWVSADFSAGNWVFSDGAEYHLGYTALNQATGSIAILSDAADGPFAGEERGSENYGVWGSMLNDWGLDVSFFIWAERCCSEIPYSDCYTDAPIQSINFFWRAPHLVYGDEAYSMKFSVGAQDTLVSVDVAIYDDAGSPSSNGDPAGDNTVFMTLYADDGTGLPGAAITSSSLPPAGYPFFPALTNFPFNYVLPGAGDYHVAFSSDGVFGVDYESCMSSDGTDGVGASASDWGGGTWVDMLSGWGLDANFYFLINICTDEYSVCNTDDAVDYFAYFWRLPDRYGDVAQAQKFLVEGVEECRLESFDLTLYWRSNENTANGWSKYQDDADISVYSDVAGAPGALLGTTTVGPADYNILESTTSSSFGNLQVDLLPLDIFVSSAYWVAVDVGPYTGGDTLRGIYTLTDDGLTGLTLGMAESWGDWTTNWGYMAPDWGLPTEVGLSSSVSTCCVPFSEYACNPGGDDDWSTNQSNYGRTGRSELPLGDSWCDLNVNWSIDHPTEGIAFTGPTVFGDQVIQGYNSEFIVYDLVSGAVNYTITSPDLAWSAIRNSGTVENIGLLGLDVLFVGCGSAQGIYAYDVATGGLIWKLNPSNGGPIAGQVRWGTFVVNDVAGTQVVYWGTDNGNVLAADAALGGLYAGWATNPVALTYSTFKNTVSDGTNLYVGTYTTAGEGDVYSIDGATGTINWQLSGTDGLQGAGLWGASYTDGDEGFQTMSYGDGTVYTNSRAGGGFPVDGIMYAINAGSGAIDWFTQSNRGYYASPIIDINRIYMPTLTGWVSPPGGGGIIGFNRTTGAIDFAMQSTSAGRYYADGFLTCEPGGAADQLFAFNEDGFLSCFNADDGLEIWRRRVFYAPGYSPNLGMSGALAPDPVSGDVHMLFASFWGGLIDFSKGLDRQRLQFESYNFIGPVEFGPLASLVVDLGPMLTNTGCIDLNISAVNVDDAPFVTDIPSFSYTNMDDNMMQRASTIANDLTSASIDKLGMRTRSIISGDQFSVRDTEKELTNSAASGFPTFINGVVTPFVGQVVAPGEVVNLTVDVIQSTILRGPQSFYIEVGSDDPDFFINDPLLLPQVYVSLVGGCLIDTTTLNFGVGGANIQLVTNTSRLGTGDWTPHGFEIDGDGASYYQGAYIYGVSDYRLATHTQDWTSGGGEADALISMQPDPNYCDGNCKPALTTGVSLGAMTTDGGVSYTPILGNMVCASYLDSVQQMGAGNWTNYTAPFDNDSTMGLYVNQRTIGVLDVPELANMTLGVMEITERNGNAVPDWYLGSFHDYDAGSLDTVEIDASISTGWVYSPGDMAWGQIKIPFGVCDGSPLINVHGMEGNQALWDMNAYFDSAYYHMTKGAGHFSQTVSTGDGEAHFTLDSHDFAPNETYTIGIANFGVTGLADNSSGAELAPLANMVNKWAGFGRGDVNDDAAINLADIIALAGYVNAAGPGPIPFLHLGDVNCDGGVDIDDVNVLIDYYFNCGACPCGAWEI